MSQFETSVAILAPAEKVWDFLIRPANLALVTPPEVGLHLTEAPEVLQLGSRIQFKLQLSGQVQHFVHDITAFEPTRQLSEKMVKGLFGKWVHEHVIAVNESNEAVVTDRVEFDPPTGLLGFLLTKKKILEYLEEGFHYRQKQLKKLLAEG